MATPSFLGSNPAELRDGALAGTRVLAVEEDLAREVMASLTPAQRRVAILSDKAPADVFWGPGRLREVLGEARGCTYAEMNAAQRALVWRLIRIYADNLAPDLAHSHLVKIEAAGRGQIRFAWMGSRARGEAHYYRIHGPTFAIEYDNVQNGANHAHCVWHDLLDDFGVDLLRRHRAHAHGAPGHDHDD